MKNWVSFLRGITTDSQIAEKDGDRPTIDTHQALAAARNAVEVACLVGQTVGRSGGYGQST